MKVDKPYASGQWSKARYFSFIRSALRSASVRWRPKNERLRMSREKYTGNDTRRKWTYTCEECGGKFKGSEVSVHHIEPCGELREYEDLPGFVKRMFCEVDGFRVICSACHRKEHSEAKKANTEKDPAGKGKAAGKKVAKRGGKGEEKGGC